MATESEKSVSGPKTVLITGASSGFGKATAELLATKGYKLVLIARRLERLEALKKSLKTDVFVASVDVTDKNQVRKFYASLPKAFLPIDVLINSAGLALGMGPAQESSLDDWDRMVDTNIKGLLYVTKAALGDMCQRERGLIINLGSVAGTLPYRGGNVYGATKAFVRQFSRNVRTDVFGTNIKVSNIEPDAAETEFSVVRFNDEAKAKQYYEGFRPLRPEDVAATISWVIEQPEHVNIDNIEIMPVDQVAAGFSLNRQK